MCLPALAAIPAALSTALTVGSLGLGLIGGVQSANAAKAQGEYEAGVANNNALLAEQRATDAYQRGAAEESKHRAAVRRAIGTQRATIAANGLDLGTGTPVDLVSETAKFGEMDALTIRANAAREAWGFQSQAEQYRADARASKAAGKNTSRGTLLTTGANFMGGLSSSGLLKGKI